MKLEIFPASCIQGTLTVPGDKSISHRAAIFGALASGETRIKNFLHATDTGSTLKVLQQLGVHIQKDTDGMVTVQGSAGNFVAPAETLFCGNSGTTMRLMLGVLAGYDFKSTFSGDESLSRRPMDRVSIPLTEMGAQISGQGERCLPPVMLQGGNLKGVSYELPVASAQVKSAILLAGLRAEGQTTVIEKTPSRDHTEQMLQGFGVHLDIKVLSDGGREITINGGQQLCAADVNVPGDISSAAFFFAAAALRPGWRVTVQNVGINPTRSGILEVLEAMGAKVLLDNQRQSGGEQVADFTVIGAPLRGAEIGGALIPRLIDELPVLAALATQAEGETVIRDAHELRVKESDRIEIISRELRKMGADIEEREDGMIVRGPVQLHGAEVTSPPGDHRIAMTLAIAALAADGATTIQNAEAIQTSFPDFMQTLNSIVQR
jgi:3-phosphoshikimate 1-carboxyvinyltransferase